MEPDRRGDALALILGVRAGLCPAPDWSRVPSLTGQDLTHAVVRELCRGKAGEIPTYFCQRSADSA